MQKICGKVEPMAGCVGKRDKDSTNRGVQGLKFAALRSPIAMRRRGWADGKTALLRSRLRAYDSFAIATR